MPEAEVDAVQRISARNQTAGLREQGGQYGENATVGIGQVPTQPPPGGGEPCLLAASAGTFYLYDGGVLVATFDHNDNVIDMFVNGPSGRIASYYQNNSSYLYYFISDQLGSTRVVMKGTPPATPSNPYIVAEFYNYYPFGQVAEASGNYATPFQWTSKEHDQHGGFDYVYFGARYYDPKIGAFGTVDKAGQFADGYVYGANNPIIGVDRDGNFFWFPVILGAVAGTYSGAQIAAAHGAQGFGFLGYVLGGAIIGAASGAAGGSIAGAIHNPVSGGLLAGAAGGLSNGLGMGYLAGARGGQLWDATWKSALSGAAGGFVSGALSTKVGGAYSSFAGGFVGGAVGYGLTHAGERDIFWKSMGCGAIGGLVSTASYKVEAAVRYHRKSYDAYFDAANREQMSRASRRTNTIGKELGGYTDGDGDVNIMAVGTENEVTHIVRPGAKALFHTQTGRAPEGMQAQPGFSMDADIPNMVKSGLPSIMIEPTKIWIGYPSMKPSALGASTNYYLMGNYYNLAVYGDYGRYAREEY